MQRNKLIRICVLTLAVLLLCAGCAGKTTPAPQGSDDTLSPPANEDIQVETSYGTLTIPFAFTDIVAVEQTKADGAETYVFSSVLDEQKTEAYTITFAPEGIEAEGELFGTLTKAEGGPVNVYYTAADPDESLEGDALDVFYAAQETINDVFESLQSMPGFVQG